jgi:hypothetical protein
MQIVMRSVVSYQLFHYGNWQLIGGDLGISFAAVVFGYGQGFLAVFSASAALVQIFVNKFKCSLYAHKS